MNFGISDNSCMFVVIQDQGINMIDENGYFYILLTTLINKIRLFKSHVVRYIFCVTVPWSELRGEQPFLYCKNSKFVTTMTKENKDLKCDAIIVSTSQTIKNQSKLEKEIATIQKKVAMLQAECKTHEAEKYRLLCYIDRYCSCLLSNFLENNPLGSRDWKKLHKQQLDLREAIK